MMLETLRLRLRPWREEDVAPFAALNADPVVMEHFPSLLGLEETRAMVERIQASWREKGLGLFAVEVKDGAPFVGFVGLAIPSYETPFTPCVEVGWRLAREHWGRGYAREAAAACLSWGFKEHALEEIVSFTALTNTRSWKVMEALGMQRDLAGDFDHPRLPAGHRLQRHLLYRLPASQWKQARETR